MSISPFTGGLVFREDLIDSSYPSQIEDVKAAVGAAAKQATAGSGNSET